MTVTMCYNILCPEEKQNNNEKKKKPTKHMGDIMKFFINVSFFSFNRPTILYCRYTSVRCEMRCEEKIDRLLAK